MLSNRVRVSTLAYSTSMTLILSFSLCTCLELPALFFLYIESFSLFNITCSSLTMSSSKQASGEEAPKRGEASNPFVAFRRFADEQLSSIFKSLFGTSSISPPPPPAAPRPFQDHHMWSDFARESHNALQWKAQEADRLVDMYARAHSNNLQFWNDESGERPVQDSEESGNAPLLSSRRKSGSPSHLDGQTQNAVSLAAFGCHLPHTCSLPVLLEDGVSLLSYLLYSPYSPVHLEQQQPLRRHGVAWREAFRDLVTAEQDENHSLKQGQVPCDDERVDDWVNDVIGPAFRKQEPDREISEKAQFWIKSCRGSKALLPFAWNIDTVEQNDDDYDNKQDDQHDDDDNDHLAETNLYNQIPGLHEATAPQQSYPSSRKQPDCLSRTNLDRHEPSILSTLTTTERTVLPDGSSQTKVVLKKRFSNGREESSETVHTQAARPPPQEQVSTQEFGCHNLATTNKETKSRGWFWS